MALSQGIIDEVISQPNQVKPIIVQFQNGQLADEETENISCGLFHDKQKDKKLLAVSCRQMVYKGYKPDDKQQLMNTMLLLHNKRTGKVRLVEAERWSVNAVLDKQVLDNDKHTSDEKMVLLNKKFGSKKAKRKTEQYEKMKVNVDAVKDDLEKTVANIKIDKEDLKTPTTDEIITDIHIPPCNRDACNVEDVYNLNDIVPENILETLNEASNKIIQCVPTGKSKYFMYIIRSLKSDPDYIKKVSILLYMDAVSKWLNIPIKDVKKRGASICPESEEINSHIIDTYSIQSNGGRLRPASMKDKAIIHCLILGLIISNYVINIELLATMLQSRIGIKKLSNLSRIVGMVPCKNDKNSYTLKLPLPKQISMVKKGRRQTL
ncbi:PREDICTED: DNA-directed RNA polymerase I subunit RPA49-like isoform X2 [Polistes dominula]|uniref:DNA-directed RNA polymerase I subunit RPA49-like isoform X2 n=1 Tax=Polistes dominula TaxID=743375 RepID=A0ABM1I8P2_POLDO|nr:PREDICTED: DNA-directed RNA polymerase I subunit RPA49-like isoform X2 [Polistes dominula]